MFKKNSHFPTKNTLNLVINERPATYYRNLAIGVIAGLVLIALFAKFAVYDRLNAANKAEAELALKQEHYNDLLATNAEYPDVKAEYEKFFTKLSDVNYADSMDALKLVENNLMPSAGVKSIALSDNVLNIELTGIGIDQASGIVKALYGSKKADGSQLVTTVDLYTIDAGDQGAALSMSITLYVPIVEAEAAEGGEAQ